MKKNLFVIVYFALIVFICIACSSMQPYKKYLLAYREIWEASSFVLEKSNSLVVSKNVFGIGNMVETNQTLKETYQFIKKNSEYMYLASIEMSNLEDDTIMLNQYYHDGYLYSQTINNPDDDYRIQQTDDFAIRTVLEGVIVFPEDVIAEQSSIDTDEGTMLTFLMDSKKYYEYCFPYISTGYNYDEFSSFREPPQYSVLLNCKGQIQRVSGRFCTINSDATAYVWDRSYVIIFTQYDDVEFDFQKLENEWPIIYNHK